MSSTPYREVGDLFIHIRNGLTVSNDEASGGIPITRIETISEGVIDPCRVGYSGIQKGEKEDWLMQAGDILFSHINSQKHIGKCAIYKGHPSELIHGMNLLSLRPDQELLDPDYAVHLIRGPVFREQLAKSIKPSVNQASVSTKDLKKIRVQVPPLETQKHIARVLEQADALRKHAQQMETELNQLAQSLFLEMFGDYFYNQITFKASACPVSEITKIIDYRGKTPEKSEQGIPLITAKNVKRGYIQEEPREYIPESLYEEWMTRGYPEESDILFTTEAPLGNVAKLGKFDRVVIGQRLLDLRCKKGLVPNYLLFALQNDIVQREIQSRSTGSTVTGIRSKEFEKVLVPVPPLDLQMKFSDMIDSLDAMKAEQKISSAQQEKLFSSLMQRAFKGELTAKAA